MRSRDSDVFGVGLADEQTILEIRISDLGCHRSSDCLTFKNVTSFVSS